MPKVTQAHNDEKTALYIDGKLVWESQFLSGRTVMEKLAKASIIQAEFLNVSKTSFDDIGRFPVNQADLKVTR